MKRYSFLPKLKYFAIVFTALVICVAACYTPPHKLGKQATAHLMVSKQPLLHIGKGQPASSSFISINPKSNVSYRIHKDEMVLDVTYKSPQAEEVTLRLYDELGSLHHMEKCNKMHTGVQRTLAFSHLKAGTYQLQLSTQYGVELSQSISLHNEVQM